MQAEDNLPTEAWGQALAKARTDEDLNIDSLSRELMLSIAQVRGLESGSLTAFHGVTYYLRALQKYAERLNVTLEPAPQTFIEAMAASKAAATRGRARPKSAPRALDYELPGGAHRPSRVGRWVVIIALLVIGTGVYLALQEGWPSSSTVNEMADARNNNRTVATRSDDATSRSPTTQTSISATDHDEALTPESTASSSEHTETANVESANTTTATEHSSDQIAAASNDTTTVASVDLTKSESAEPSVDSVAQRDQGALPTADSDVDAERTPKQEDPDATTTSEAASTSDTGSSEAQNDEQSPQSLIQRRTSTDALVLTFTGDCWVEVRQDTGQVTQKVYKAGESLEVPLKETERVVLGNITAVKAERAGKTLDLTEFTRGSATVARINVPALLGEN